MSGILDNFNISGNVGDNFMEIGNQPDMLSDEAQRKYEKSERNRKLIWVGFGAIVCYFAYTSFIKK